jgi:hypothetical protein
MAKYRKKPIVVEAEQFWPENMGNWPKGVYGTSGADAYVVTIHCDRARVSRGDWVIMEPDGIHHYPCKPDVFKATYEPL